MEQSSFDARRYDVSHSFKKISILVRGDWWRTLYVLRMSFNIISFCYRTEDEMGVDDISTLEVTEDMQKKFVDFDKETIKDPEPDEKKE